MLRINSIIVKFPPGTSTTTLKGIVKGYDTARYTLGARAGQSLSVLFRPSNPSCYFNVTAPGANEATYNGSIDGTNAYTGQLTVSGDQEILVYQMRNESRRGTACQFTLNLTVDN